MITPRNLALFIIACVQSNVTLNFVKVLHEIRYRSRDCLLPSATSGARLATIYINGAHSQDWEDIACGPCTGGSGHCVYIGDTGGNAGGDANTIYRIREPSSIHDQSVNVDGSLEFR